MIDEPGLEVPHPRMHERAFVLLPLAEIDPAARVPGRGTGGGAARAVWPHQRDRRESMLPKRYRYIVVEGPIGVGKTSLARLLAEHAGADTLLEQPADNPFLASFYQEPRRWALATQLFFLFQRVNQLAGSSSSTCSSARPWRTSCSTRTPLFARLNLRDDELALYQRIYAHLAPQVPIARPGDLPAGAGGDAGGAGASARRRVRTRHQRGIPGAA